MTGREEWGKSHFRNALQSDYYNRGHLDKVDQLDGRKVTIHSENWLSNIYYYHMHETKSTTWIEINQLQPTDVTFWTRWRKQTKCISVYKSVFNLWSSEMCTLRSCFVFPENVWLPRNAIECLVQLNIFAVRRSQNLIHIKSHSSFGQRVISFKEAKIPSVERIIFFREKNCDLNFSESSAEDQSV